MIKKYLSAKQIFNINLGLFGIQFIWILQILGISIIFTCIGTKLNNLGYIWLAIPLSSLLVHIYFNYFWKRPWTASTRNQLILISTPIASISLTLITNTNSIIIAILLLWILNITLNINLQSYTSLNNYINEKSHQKFIYIQKLLITCGSICAAISPFLISTFFQHTDINIKNIPVLLKYTFYTGATILLLTNLWTIFFNLEMFRIPPERQLQQKFKYREMIKTKIIYTQFFSWLGLFCFFIYFPFATIQNLFNIKIHSANIMDYPVYLTNNITIAGLCIFIYISSSFLYSYLISILNKMLSINIIYAISLITAGLCLTLTNWIYDTNLLLLSMVGVGIGYYSITEIGPSIFYKKITNKNAFNFTIWIPQITLSLLINPISKNIFANNPNSIVAISGMFLLIPAVIAIVLEKETLDKSNTPSLIQL